MTSLWLPHIDHNLCTGCRDCITQCPAGALGWQGSKAALVQPQACIYCATCEDICLVGAVELPYLILKNKKEQTDEQDR